MAYPLRSIVDLSKKYTLTNKQDFSIAKTIRLNVEEAVRDNKSRCLLIFGTPFVCDINIAANKHVLNNKEEREKYIRELTINFYNDIYHHLNYKKSQIVAAWWTNLLEIPTIDNVPVKGAGDSDLFDTLVEMHQKEKEKFLCQKPAPKITLEAKQKFEELLCNAIYDELEKKENNKLCNLCSSIYEICDILKICAEKANISPLCFPIGYRTNITRWKVLTFFNGQIKDVYDNQKPRLIEFEKEVEELIGKRRKVISCDSKQLEFDTVKKLGVK